MSFMQLWGYLLVKTRELHGDGNDGITAVLRLYDRHRGNGGDGDSIHGSTAVAVTELTFDTGDRVAIELLRNECRTSDPCTPTL